MADFENGLPPEGVDVSNMKINAVLIGKSEVSGNADAYKVSAVLIDKSEVQKQQVNQISAVLIDKEPAGRNSSMFL
ncbi:hypothetical protein JGH11_13240 [Dysgonomonas sp. Marseille-P4677]|uniref:hypothetical protein n=1 Tax=Dysgonomonas sp. Marseille-P4677 TaxID=2364790 RepID=UPI001911BF77|nr:hypothetical protein [Dysgonomonas sp. Marseille-P4677]MBK5721838.1 hypothetical protein [Dysgonomonas sp. Marseille-P4677]